MLLEHISLRISFDNGRLEASFEKGDIKAKVKYDAPKGDKKDTHDASVDDLKSLAKYENQ